MTYMNHDDGIGSDDNEQKRLAPSLPSKSKVCGLWYIRKDKRHSRGTLSL